MSVWPLLCPASNHHFHHLIVGGVGGGGGVARHVGKKAWRRVGGGGVGECQRLFFGWPTHTHSHVEMIPARAKTISTAKRPAARSPCGTGQTWSRGGTSCGYTCMAGAPFLQIHYACAEKRRTSAICMAVFWLAGCIPPGRHTPAVWRNGVQADNLGFNMKPGGCEKGRMEKRRDSVSQPIGRKSLWERRWSGSRRTDLSVLSVTQRASYPAA
jgi:hypothetical protein